MSDKLRRRRVSGPPAQPGERLIRKYGNRRLYDTRDSRYVTLEDLVEVFAGEEAVRVVDAVSGEDLTKRVLAQAILFEESRRRTQIIPIELLRALLRHRGEPSREAYEKKLVRALTDEESRPVPVEAQRAGGDASAVEMAELRRRLKALESQVRKGGARRAR